jgi:DNA ligase-1
LKVREDKSIEEASTDEFLAELWRNQQARASTEQQGDEKQELDIEEE